jgi:hypothetical protein
MHGSEVRRPTLPSIDEERLPCARFSGLSSVPYTEYYSICVLLTERSDVKLWETKNAEALWANAVWCARPEPPSLVRSAANVIPDCKHRNFITPSEIVQSDQCDKYYSLLNQDYI